jgi:hypothetical protein
MSTMLMILFISFFKHRPTSLITTRDMGESVNDTEICIGPFKTENEAYDWIKSMSQEFERRKSGPDSQYSVRVRPCYSPKYVATGTD